MIVVVAEGKFLTFYCTLLISSPKYWANSNETNLKILSSRRTMLTTTRRWETREKKRWWMMFFIDLISIQNKHSQIDRRTTNKGSSGGREREREREKKKASQISMKINISIEIYPFSLILIDINGISRLTSVLFNESIASTWEIWNDLQIKSFIHFN